MAANTTIITSTKGLAAPTALTVAASAAAGLDYVGMTTATFEAIAHAKRSYAMLAAVTNAGDPNLTTLNNILLSLS